MRMETAITSSPDSECIPRNLFQPCVLCFPFCFGQKQIPIAQCNTCYLMGRGEKPQTVQPGQDALCQATSWVWAAFHNLFEQKRWTTSFSQKITSVKCPICSFPLAPSLKASVTAVYSKRFISKGACNSSYSHLHREISWLRPMHGFYFVQMLLGLDNKLVGLYVFEMKFSPYLWRPKPPWWSLS